MNSVITAHNPTKKSSSKALMGQVSEEKSLDPPSGRLGCNLDDYIKRESPTRRGIEDCKEGKLEKLRERERERERERILLCKNKCKPSPQPKTKVHCCIYLKRMLFCFSWLTYIPSTYSNTTLLTCQKKG